MKRPMRLRQNQWIRDLVAESGLHSRQLIQPLFVGVGLTIDQPVPGLGETMRQSVDGALARIEKDIEGGVRHFILFQLPGVKSDVQFSHSFSMRVISEIKKRFGPDIFLWVDTCLCSLTAHGHCCVFDDKGKTDLPKTLRELAQLAVSHIEAGADGVSPSDMMDGRTSTIRTALDSKGFGMAPIMSYSTKFSSQFYGPFRAAADSSPKFGDRKQYQIDPRNRTDAIQASVRCAEEGADLLMVKPGMTSIDLISEIREKTGRPVGAYQVSGEYAALNFLAEHGLTKFDDALLETWNVFKRAGAQYIITYGARHAKRLGLPIN